MVVFARGEAIGPATLSMPATRDAWSGSVSQRVKAGRKLSVRHEIAVTDILVR